MTATPLSSGPVMGVLTSSASSPIFSVSAGLVAVLKMVLSPLAYSNSTVALMRSLDGGVTWASYWQAASSAFPPAPTQMPLNGSPAGQLVNAVQVANGSMTVALNSAVSCLYQLTCSLSAGSLLFLACNPTPANRAFSDMFGMYNPAIEPGGSSGTSLLGMTTAELLSLYQSRSTPAPASGPMTIYKRCLGGSIATLTVPASASIGFDNSDEIYGPNRCVRASSASVSSVTDASGNAIASAASYADAQTVYSAGATIVAKDLFGLSTGAFASNTYMAGIRGFPTLLEAAAFATAVPNFALANLAALGL